MSKYIAVENVRIFVGFRSRLLNLKNNLIKMNKKSKKHVQEKIWFFDVTDPTLHPKGFTIYKVTCKVFPVSAPEELTEIVVWKRYNDFKELHRSLIALHKALHRRDEFPVFARPKLFGRFDESVIEERKQSALDLLEFVGRFPHLYTATSFCKFLEGGKKIENNSRGVKNLLIPSVLDVVPTGHPEKSGGLESSLDLPPIVPVENLENVVLTVDSKKETKSPIFTESMDKGTWNFPQPSDNISIDSFDDNDSSLADTESSVNSPLPDTDLSFFDPLKTDMKIPENTQLRPSKSWLLDALNTCAEIDAEDQVGISTEESIDGGIHIEFPEQSSSTSDFGSASDSKTENNVQCTGLHTNTEVDDSSSSTDLSKIDVMEFDPLKDRSLSKVEIGKGDFECFISESSGSRSASLMDTVSRTSTPESPSVLNSRQGNRSASTSPSKSPCIKGENLSRSPRKSRTGTNESVSNMDMGSKDDYIHLAARQICKAQECEASGMFEIAFSQYKTGVGILLQGVQGDKNKGRRDAVRRKTAQYLMKAEDIYNRYLAKETVDERRWAVDSLLSPTLDMDPALTFIRAPSTELRNYKVLGTVGKALLVMDRMTDETYVIKTLKKSCMVNDPVQTILPTSCPFMVNLFKFFETQNAVYLLLQYASGGKLWEYVGAYLQYGRNMDETQANKDHSSGSNVYSGFRLPPDVDDLSMNEKMQSKVNKLNKSSAKAKSSPMSSDIDNKCFIHPGLGTALDKTSPEEKCSNSYVQLFVKTSQQKHPEEGMDINVKYQKGNNSKTVESGGTESSADDHSSQKTSANCEQMTKNALCRKLSGLSDDNIECDPDFKSESFSEKYLIPGERFQDILKNHNSSLEKFSFTSSDDEFVTSRQNSTNMDNIESIPELCENTVNSEVEDVFPGGTSNEVRHERSWSKVNFFSPPDVDNVEVPEADEIVLNSRALLASVERTLSQVEKEEEIEEPSIYDMHHTSDSSETSPSTDTIKTISSCKSLDSGSASQATDARSSDENEKTSPDSETCSKASPEAVSKNIMDVISSQFSLNENISKRRRNPSGKNLTLCRINSKELTRSASFESELRSPTKTRSRTVSTVFQELDALASQPDQIKIPENCIKQWAAEIVVCVSRLHSMGIICRDLNPDNILLGDRGHVILTYFCQIGQCDSQIDEVAREMLYVAPEVSHWTQYKEVCDWWSVGAIIYELLVGKSLFSCHPAGVTSHTQLLIPSHVSPEASRLLQELLRYSPKERLGGGINSSEEIKAHPFFHGIDWHILET